jgi:nicotinate-nucleotide pyrophosphorylase (carboxylating)
MSLRFDFSASAVAALALADATRALQEDVADGDLTASLVAPERRARARVLARDSAVRCGAPWVEATLRQLDPQARITWLCGEGERCAADQTVLEIEGAARALLTAERTSLNFLQLLSAVATKTALYADAIKGTRARIVDTRKTLPGLRLAQKYAVRTGGGVNHRIGLYDAVLIKENHIAAAGGVAAALRAVAPVAAQAAFVARPGRHRCRPHLGRRVDQGRESHRFLDAFPGRLIPAWRPLLSSSMSTTNSPRCCRAPCATHAMPGPACRPNLCPTSALR